MDDMYSIAVLKLKKEFSRKVSLTIRGLEFRRRIQKEEESISDYASALRTLVSFCEYGELEDRMLREQFIVGVKHQFIRERLISNSISDTKTNFDLSVLLAEQMTAVKVDTATASQEQTSNAMSQNYPVNIVKNSSRKQPWKKVPQHSGAEILDPCSKCGYTTHTSGICPAADRNCAVCKQRGHYARVCRNRVDSSSGGSSRNFNNVSSRRVINTIVNCLDCDIDSVPYAINIGVCNTELLLDLDTGSGVNTLTEATVDSLQCQNLVRPTCIKLSSFSGSEIHAIGELCVPITFNNKNVNTKFIVTCGGHNLCGRSLMDALSLTIEHTDKARVTTCVNIVDSNTERATADNIKTMYPKLFNGIGKAKHFCHYPQIKEKFLPSIVTQAKCPERFLGALKNELDRLVAENIIVPVDASETVNRCVFVTKSDGTLRLCIDMRSVNEGIIANRHPLPNIETLVSNIKGKVFCKLDLASGFHQMPLHPDAQNLTAFTTPFGLFKYTRLLFGIVSGPSAFQAMMDQILAGLGNESHYIDDILIWGETEFECKKNLIGVLDRLLEHGLTLNFSKCAFFVREVQYLGYSFKDGTTAPSNSKVECLLAAAPPKDKKELQSLLGLANYFSKFISNLSDILAPLRHVLTEKNFSWNAECQSALDDVKIRLTAKPVLRQFEPNTRIAVYTDASDHGLGAVLCQPHEGLLKPVMYASRTLNSAEKNYSVSERECLAIIWALERWQYYLLGRRFDVYTDHNALTTILSPTVKPKTQSARLSRWLQRLLAFVFDIHYIRGESNVIADYLSRLPTCTEQIQEFSNTAASDISYIVTDSFKYQALDNEELLKEQQNCPILAKLREYVVSHFRVSLKSPEISQYFSVQNELSISEQGLLLCNGVPIVPHSLQEKVTGIAHEGHPGMTRTLLFLKENVWFSKMSAYVKQYVSQCSICSNSEKSLKIVKSDFDKIPDDIEPWQLIHIDITGPFESAPASYRYLLTIVDHGSKFVEVFHDNNFTANNICKCIFSIFSRYGNPATVVTDNGPQFTSDEFIRFLRALGVRHTPTPVYYPEANAQAERFHRSLKDSIKVYLKQGYTWADAIDVFLYHHRRIPHSRTKQSPLQKFLGRPVNGMLNTWSLQRFFEPESPVPPNRAIQVDQFVKVKRRCGNRAMMPQWSDAMKVVEQVGSDSFLLENGKKYSGKWLAKVKSGGEERQSLDERQSLEDFGNLLTQPPMAVVETSEQITNETDEQPQTRHTVRRSSRRTFGRPPERFF